MRGTRVYLEQGRTWTFAVALDWPGWARRGKGDEAALEALLSYADRYRLVVPELEVGELHVVGAVPGNGTTEFGAPNVRGPWDEEPADGAVLAHRMEQCWAAFDRAVAGSTAELRKGPRGGGRDRDDVAAHLQEAERSDARTLGVRLPPRTPWREQRTAFAEAVRSGAPAARYPLPYVVRTSAWHVLDHAWEIEDKSLGPSAADR